MCEIGAPLSVTAVQYTQLWTLWIICSTTQQSEGQLKDNTYLSTELGQILNLQSIEMPSDYAKKKAAKKKEAVKVKMGKKPGQVKK